MACGVARAARVVLCLLGLAAALAPVAASAKPPVARDVSQFRLLRLDDHRLKWGPATLGTSAKVTWAFLEPRRTVSGRRNCKRMRSMAAFAARAGLDGSPYREAVVQAFETWANVSGLSFEQVERSAEADVVIGGQGGQAGIAFTDVDWVLPAAGGAGAEGGVATLTKALICLDASEPWELGFDGDNATRDLRYVVTHEIGHAIGLDHIGRKGALMGFGYFEDRSELTVGDAKGAVRLYGPPKP